MKPPLFVRPLTDEELNALKGALRATDSFTLRRAQILLNSAKGQLAAQIAETLGCAVQTVYNAIHDFNDRRLSALERQSNRPKTIESAFDETRAKASWTSPTSPRAPSAERGLSGL